MGKHNKKRDHIYSPRPFVLLIGMCLIFPCSLPVLAHGVYIYAWRDGNSVYTESYFGAKRKVKEGIIRVYDLSGKKLLEGKTNERGEFSFESPQNVDLRIVLEAGMGHQSEYVLKAETHVEHEHGKSEIGKPGGVVQKTDSHETVSSISAEEIQEIVEKALDAHLRPIRQALAAIRNEKGPPGLTEIIGGIGYIFGIMGVMMYLKRRKG